jgi:hypothetical protein
MTGGVDGRPRAPALPVNLYRAFVRDYLSPTSSVHPSTPPFLRAFLLGYVVSVVPAIVRALVHIVRRRKDASTRARVSFLIGAVLKAVKAGFSVRSLGCVFGVAVGGAKWAEPFVRPLVSRAYLSYLKIKSRYEEQPLAAEAEASLPTADRSRIDVLSTFVSASLSSLAAFVLLQSSPAYRPNSISSIVPVPVTADDAGQNNGNGSGLVRRKRRYETHTLDLTLFVLVRAVDSIVRGTFFSVACPSLLIS